MRILGPVSVALALFMPLSATAQSRTLSGSYMAAAQAELRKDHAETALYYTRALGFDTTNTQLMLRAMQAQVAKGDVSVAATIAVRLLDLNSENQFATLVALTQDVREGDPARGLARLDMGEQGMTPLLADLLRGWVLLAMGATDDALAIFEDIGGNETLTMFGNYHAGLALATLGRYTEAAAYLEDSENGPVLLNRRSTLSRAQVLANAGREQDALSLLDQVLITGFGDTEFEALRQALEAGDDVPFTVLNNASDGVAEVFYDLASVLGEDSADVALVYGRLATHLSPDFVEALLLVAGILDGQGQFALAVESYDSVPSNAPQFIEAELGRAAALDAADRPDEAIGVLTGVTRAYPDRLRPHYLLGEALRRADRDEEALRAFDRAISLVGEVTEQHWVVFYNRAIAYHNLDRWSEAEADFRVALELSDQNPLVLNYLGYSLVEERQNLDEALAMIELAVEKRPNDGYITDSLGWVLYRMERFEDAVIPMERAVELAPLDPVVNDHLGDVYWMVGREREARFQWRRAQSFEPTDDDAARIRRKLDVGLDVVLADEAAAENPQDITSE